jgi:hypothetical protein
MKIIRANPSRTKKISACFGKYLPRNDSIIVMIPADQMEITDIFFQFIF